MLFYRQQISEIVTKNGETVVMRQIYTYKSRVENGETLSSDLVDTITTTVGSATTTEQYNYNSNGNIISIYRNNAKIKEYQYDDLNELTAELDFSRNKQYNYSYDTSGNIRAAAEYDMVYETPTTYTPVFNSVQTYDFNDSNWSDKLTSYNGAVSYDGQGNPTSLNGFSFTWKNGRQLGSASKNGVTSTYSYDSNGIRTSKVVSDSVNYSGESHSYTTIDGRITSDTFSTGGASLAGTEGTLYFVYDEQGSIVGFDLSYTDRDNDVTINGNYTYIKNLVGDIVGVIDSEGNTVATYSYDAWGKLESSSGVLANIKPMRYKGYYYDSDTGMYYLQSRYYDPSLKRFINADEPEIIADLASKTTLGSNMFSYCENNAINALDQNGKESLIQKVLNMLNNAIKVIKDIIDVMISSVTNDIKKITKVFNSNKVKKQRALLNELKKSLNKMSSRMRIIAVTLALTVAITIIATNLMKSSSDFISKWASIIAELFVMFISWAITKIVQILVEMIPAVGTLISVFVAVLGSVAFVIFFSSQRINKIQNSVKKCLNDIRKKKKRFSMLSIIGSCFRGCF